MHAMQIPRAEITVVHFSNGVYIKPTIKLHVSLTMICCADQWRRKLLKVRGATYVAKLKRFSIAKIEFLWNLKI